MHHPNNVITFILKGVLSDKMTQKCCHENGVGAKVIYVCLFVCGFMPISTSFGSYLND